MTSSSAPPNCALTTKLEWALQHLSRGWAVLPLWWVGQDGQCACGKRPCPHTGKHPLGKLAPHGYKSATHAAGQAMRWWQRYPEANIGGATGAVSGRTVLDVDLRNGGGDSLKLLTLLNDQLPDTQRHRSQSGGPHFVFRYRAGDPPASKGFNAGLDWLSNGSMVVLPGSVGPKGEYVEELGWGPENLPIADPPEWLLGLVRSHQGNGILPRPSPRSGLP